MLTKRRLILICIGVGLIGLFLVVISVGELRGYRDSLRTKAQLEHELAQLPAPSAATFIRHSVVTKGSHGVVSNLYRSDLSYEIVRAHYEKEFSQRGWKFRSVDRLTSWGKDLGETETIYCRGNQKAYIFWTGSNRTPENIRYTLGFSWGWGDCG